MDAGVLCSLPGGVHHPPASQQGCGPSSSSTEQPVSTDRSVIWTFLKEHFSHPGANSHADLFVFERQITHNKMWWKGQCRGRGRGRGRGRQLCAPSGQSWCLLLGTFVLLPGPPRDQAPRPAQIQLTVDGLEQVGVSCCLLWVSKVVQGDSSLQVL